MLSLMRGMAPKRGMGDEELDRNVEEEIARNLWVRDC